MKKNKILNTGAEAQIIIIDDNTLKKLRNKKKYRIEVIDNKLRKFRNRREFKILNNLHQNNILAPKPYELFEKEEYSFTFEYIKGNILKSVINYELLKKAFLQIINIHNLDIIHGDLTTLNMIEKDNEIYLIDFGLSNFSNKAEDKAVDLNLFFKSIKNEHPNLYQYKKSLENHYLKNANNANKTIERLKAIEKRGRNK